MKTNRYIIASFFLILLALGIGLTVYSQLPDQVASHWNIRGEVDGYMSKFWGTFIMPIISLAMLVLLVYIPNLDPKKKNIEEFENYYHKFIFVLIAFFFYLHILTLSWNLGYTFNIMQMLAPAFGMLFYFIGVLLENSKQNWFIGIRTPWTLSSEKVWKETHKLGGKIFKLGALIVSLGVIFPNLFFAFMLISVFIFILFSFGYSYYIYQQNSPKKKS